MSSRPELQHSRTTMYFADIIKAGYFRLAKLMLLHLPFRGSSPLCQCMVCAFAHHMEKETFVTKKYVLFSPDWFSWCGGKLADRVNLFPAFCVKRAGLFGIMCAAADKLMSCRSEMPIASLVYKAATSPASQMLYHSYLQPCYSLVSNFYVLAPTSVPEQALLLS